MTSRRDPIHAAIDRDLDHLNITADGRRMIHAIIDVELDNPSAPDGYATDRRVAPGSRSTTGTSATERTGTQRLAPHQRDEYRDHVRNMISFYQDAAKAKQAADRRVALILGIVKPLIREDENDQCCWCMIRVDVREPVARRIIVDGLTLPLGEWAYNFRTRNRRLPTVDECRRHARGERVMLDADTVNVA